MAEMVCHYATFFNKQIVLKKRTSITGSSFFMHNTAFEVRRIKSQKSINIRILQIVYHINLFVVSNLVQNF